MEEERPNPDDLLERLKLEEPINTRGRLKLFFGYAAGVGKTYTMLEAAQQQVALGIDVVAGYVQLHGRKETERLLHGLDILPTRKVLYRHVILEEFDLDAALARKPQLLLVDELAHTNAPECRHPKRWQDVQELLEAGINVYSTMNVQHLEALNDVVAQITGVIVQETVPDAVVETADEIELIDLPPDDLLERFREGKIYIPAQAEKAVDSFFKKANLIALRELSLRKTAERINRQVQSARRSSGSQTTWQTSERLLVCVGPSSNSTKVIRSAKRLANSLQADWIVAHVETPQSQKINDKTRQQLLNNLHLAEQLGAEVVTLTGHNRADEIVKYAHARNVTKIVVGKTVRSIFYRLLHGSVADELQSRSKEIDIYVVPGEAAEKVISDPKSSPQAVEKKRGYKRSALIVLLCTLLAGLMHVGQLAEANKVMVYLLGVVFIAARYGMGPGIFASILSVLLFDVLMVRPYFSFAVNDTQYLLMFVVMLGIAILISALTARISQQAEMMRQRMQRTEALYRLSKQLAGTTGLHQLVVTVEKELADMFQAEIIIYIVQSAKKLVPVTSTHEYLTEDFIERGVAHWVFAHGKVAGIGTDTLPQAGALYLPLIASQGAVGVLGISQKEKHSFLPDQIQLLETFAGQIAIALERDQFADQTKQMMIDVEAEKMRNALLSSISHDFRTPLSVIAATSQQLLSNTNDGEPEQRELIHTVVDETNRLNRYVDNLLEITRIESGNVKPDMQLNVIDDVIGSALNSRKNELATRPITVTVPDHIPATMMDSVLIERVLINLLDNAIRYTPVNTSIVVSVTLVEKMMQVTVSDHGPGISEFDKERIFEKFYRHDTERGNERSGTGLGLAICHAIIKMHGGAIYAENNVDGGAKFTFTIPVTENQFVVTNL